MKKVDEAIHKFNSGVAYYNRACNLSVMAEFKIPMNDTTPFNDGVYKQQSLSSLEAAFARIPVLVVHSRNDQDLKWIKGNCPEEFYRIVGRVYDNHYNILK